MALIAGANFTVHGDPAKATLWTFKPEDGNSLMDTIVANIMKAALGMKDFEDQLMERGIFVFIVGINGLVLARQRVFGRRRQHEQELMRSGMLPIEAVKDVTGYESEGKGAGGEMVGDEECGGGKGFGEGKRDFYEDMHLHHHQGAQGVERLTTTDQVLAQTVGASTTATTTISSGVGVGGGPIENTPNTNSTDSRPTPLPTTPPTAAKAKENSTAHSKDQTEDKKSDDSSPDFATMSFLAWFNYLQVGILIIEFLQLFSFPL
ncbi:hypothetical protein BGW39_000630 [Mortierella sp. 14UC]|nr:hypothetical protein BGW39_000630 [Mortierella sp. 14UC]